MSTGWVLTIMLIQGTVTIPVPSYNECLAAKDIWASRLKFESSIMTCTEKVFTVKRITF